MEEMAEFESWNDIGFIGQAQEYARLFSQDFSRWRSQNLQLPIQQEGWPSVHLDG